MLFNTVLNYNDIKPAPDRTNSTAGENGKDGGSGK
jgi:hypothetical protein